MAKYIGNIPSVGEFKKLDSLTSTFNGSLTQFDLEYGSTSVSVGDASQLIVSLNGIIQEPLTAYTLAVGGSAIVFSSAPASTDTCHIILLGGVGGTSTVSDGAVTAAKLDAGLKDYLEETYTANGSQTTYTLTRAPIGTNDLMITIDGIVQPSTAYSIAGTTLTISPALPNGTDVRVVHMGVRAGFVVPSSSSITAAMFQDFTTDVKFNDSAKAVFGTGDDLQIYHNGSNSYIKDAGTGNLNISTNGGELALLTQGGLEYGVRIIQDGAVEIRHDDSTKLATTSIGIDVTGTVTSDGLTVDGTTRFDNYGSTTGIGRIQFGNSGQKFIEGFDTGNAGSGSYLKFGSGSTTQMTLDNSGNLLVGKTVTTQSTPGTVLYSSGQIYNTASGTHPLVVTRNTNDGALALFYKDTNEVGRIFSGHGSTQLGIGTNTTGITFNPNTRSVMPANPSSTSPQLDATLDLGFSSVRWRDLFLSGGIYLGGTGSANKLDDYEEGTWTPSILVEVAGAAGITVNHATYTKIGRLVSLVFDVTINSVTGTNSSRAIQLEGMPFIINTAGGGGPNIGYTNLINSMTGNLALQGRFNTRYRIVNLNGATGQNASDHIQASTVLRGQFTYHTDQ